jgi:hypothetical protein
MTVPGRYNLIGTAGVLVIVLGAGALDLLQAVVRIWQDHYETGLPSVLTFLWVFVALVLACTAILALVELPKRDRES